MAFCLPSSLFSLPSVVNAVPLPFRFLLTASCFLFVAVFFQLPSSLFRLPTAVKERFPEEFMFQLNQKEKYELVTNWHQFDSLKHSRSNPYAFTEYGIAMLASVLKSRRAIQVNIQIVRVFIKLNQYLATHQELARRFKELETRVGRKIGKQDEKIESIINVINRLLLRPSIEVPKQRFRIRGFAK